MNTLTKLDGR